VASANALFNPLRIPRQIIIDREIAELEVDPLRRRFALLEPSGHAANRIQQRYARTAIDVGPGELAAQVLGQRMGSSNVECNGGGNPIRSGRPQPTGAAKHPRNHVRADRALRRPKL
jgi:hypothetical protein